MSRIAYVARPIDYAKTGEWKKSVRHATAWLQELGWLVFSPADAWHVDQSTAPGREIELINRHVLSRAGLVVAFLPAGVRTVGVPMEVEYAASRGVPTAVVGADTDKSWALAGASVSIFTKYTEFASWLEHTASAPDRTMDVIRFAVGPFGTMPTRTHTGDAGWDLYSSEAVRVDPGKFVDVPTDVRVALPPDTWARITGRSSTWRSWGLHTVDGVIDEGYRGQLFSAVHNIGQIAVDVPAGTRLTQLILHQNLGDRYLVSKVGEDAFDQLPSPDGRGSAGFGSTGVGSGISTS